MAIKLPNENSVTSAIRSAALLYCDQQYDKWPIFTSLASNQQGVGLNRLCGDLIIALDSYRVGLFEIKELDKERLHEFDEEQHLDCVAFEQLGVPIEYAYGRPNLQNYLRKADPESPRRVLSEIKRSKPSDLPGIEPKNDHHSLLSWFAEDEASGRGVDGMLSAKTVWEGLGCAHAAFLAGSEHFRNSALILLYSTERRSVMTLTPKQLVAFVALLNEGKQLTKNQQTVLERLLKQSKKVLDGYERVKKSRPSQVTVVAPSTAIDLNGAQHGTVADESNPQVGEDVPVRPRGPAG